MRARRTSSGMRRGLAALAGLLAGTAGLTIGAATPAAADPPQFSYFQPPSSLPYGYSSAPDEPIGILFTEVPDGGTLTFLADASPISGCTYPVTAPRSIYMCSLSTLMPGTYTISATYSGGTFDGFTVVMAPDVEIRLARSTIAPTFPSPVPAGVDFTVSAVIHGDEEGSSGPVDGVQLRFSVPGDTCVSITSATGVASCTLTAPTDDSTADPTTDFDLGISFDGDARYSPSIGRAGIALAKWSTATSVTVVPNTGSWGTQADVTATITPNGATGTVAFSDESGLITGCGAVTVVGGSASCTYPLPLGLGAVTATYSGDAQHQSSSGQLGTQGFQRSTSVHLASPVGLTVGSATSVSATVDDQFTGGALAGATVYFTLGGASCSAATGASGVASCQITPQNTADTTLQAESIATSLYARSFDTITGLTVAKQATTTTLAPATAQYQAPLTITATVDHADADGTVDFRTDGDPIGGCEARPVTLAAGSWTATCTTTTFGVGTFPVVAIYSGTANTDASTSPSQNVSVTPAETTLTYTGDTSATVGIEPTGSAVLRSNATGAGIPDQPVSFTWADGICGARTDDNGVATCRLYAPTNAGAQTLTVAYADTADERYLGSSTTATIAVARAATTTTLQVPATAVYGELTQLVALVTPPGITGTVEFTVDGSAIGGCRDVQPTVTVLGYQATCTTTNLDAGDHQIGATFSGNTDYEPSSAPDQPLTVGPGPTALEYTGDTTATVGMPATVRARLTRDGNDPATGPLAGHAVTFSGAGDTCTDTTDASGVAECTITPTETGSRPITARFVATARYQASDASVALLVERASTATVLDAPAGAQFGEAVQLTAVVAPTDGDGTVTFRAAPNGSLDAAAIAGCSDLALELVGEDWFATCTTSALPAGALTLTAAYSGGGQHLPSIGTGTTEIRPAWTAVGYTGASAGTVASPLTLAATLIVQPGGPPFGQLPFPISAVPTAVPLALQPAAPLPGMTLTFTLGDLTCTAQTDAAGVASCTVTPTSVAQAGAVQISFAGTSQYASASAASGVAVAPAATSVALSAPSTVGFSLPVQLVATVSPFAPGGTVTFGDGGVAIHGCEAAPVTAAGGVGTATCQTTWTALGAHELTASFGGNGSYLPSASTPHTMTVVLASTELIYLGPSTAPAGTPVTVSAMLVATDPTAPTASVATRSFQAFAAPPAVVVPGQTLVFTFGDASCSAVTGADGVASCTLLPGAAAAGTIVVTFAGAPGFAASTEEVAFAVAAAPVPPAGPTAPDPGNPTLPATGSDTSTVLLVALGLLATGFLARRVRRRHA